MGWLVEEGELGMMRVAMALSKLVEGDGCYGQSVEVIVVRYKQVKRIVEDEGGWKRVKEIMAGINMRDFHKVRERIQND